MNDKENIKNDLPDYYPVISVIIPFHGESADLENCISGLKKQNFQKPFEIIVVQSGSDINIKTLSNKFKNIVLISNNSLLYPGKARNHGVINSKADFLAFIDADCVPAPTWLSEIYYSLKKRDEVIIGPVVNLYPFHPIASVDNMIQFSDFPKYRRSESFDHFPGCNIGIKREMFIKSGGFPEEISIGEDTKFSEALIKIYKAKISFKLNMIVKHAGRKNIKDFLKHHSSFGYSRGYSNQHISSFQDKFRHSFLYSIIFGGKRLTIIFIRTLQWNQPAIIRFIFYFPFLILGLSAWTFGLWKGSKEALKGKN